MRFSIRDLLWLMLLAGVVLAWMLDHSDLVSQLATMDEGTLTLVPVQGKVMRDGRPMTNLVVTVYYPDGNNAIGACGDSGEFFLTYSGRLGALAGERLPVTIMNFPADDDANSPRFHDAATPDTEMFRAYTNPATSPIRIDVPAGGTSNLVIELKK